MAHCILPYMRVTPPSRYEYASDAEFDAAMDEWCRDHEPQYTIIHNDGTRQPVTGWDEAVSLVGYGTKAAICTRIAGRIHNGAGMYPTLDRQPSGDGKYDHGVSYRDGDHALLHIR